MAKKKRTKMVVIGWMTRESFERLTRGGNYSRNTTPVHAYESALACIPVYVWSPPLERE